MRPNLKDHSHPDSPLAKNARHAVETCGSNAVTKRRAGRRTEAESSFEEPRFVTNLSIGKTHPPGTPRSLLDLGRYR